MDNHDFLTGRELAVAKNSEATIKAHRERTGGKVITRFPPEPNGFLHIGHAKAINFNFGVAKKHEGECILRFDDTNPEAEKKVYIDAGIETIRWLGHTPSKITYSSDYFDQLHALAVKLVKLGKAYVCHMTTAEIKESKSKRPPVPSPWRNRPVAENLRLFDDMRKGKFEEGAATLRVKGDLKSPNPNMWDYVAYRIKYVPHPHVGSKWCVYPSYDFTHCLVDSLEDITHSLCTLEFENRRESYFALLDALDMYKPRVWEYSRLNVEGAVISKRQIKLLIDKGIVRGWDDPRLMTVSGLRRRGVTPEAINAFCEAVGVTRSQNFIAPHIFYHHVREHLNDIAPRRFVVLDPLKVTLTNLTGNEKVIAPNHPVNVKLGSRSLVISPVVWIDRSDFRLEANRRFYGLAPGRSVFLKYAFNITCTDHKLDADGRVIELTASLQREGKRPKGKLHWVSFPDQRPVRGEVRVYGDLLRPGEGPFLSRITPKSETVKHALLEPSLADTKAGERFQFERVGYCVADKDTRPGAPVFNMTCTLKVSAKAKQARK